MRCAPQQMNPLHNTINDRAAQDKKWCCCLLYTAEVDIRKLLSLGMKFKSSSAILAHNHPSGVALPSQDDLETTGAICKALESVGVHLIDHIIVAEGDYVSLADSGILEDLRQ